jgi:hypothetical protein
MIRSAPALARISACKRHSAVLKRRLAAGSGQSAKNCAAAVDRYRPSTGARAR